MILKRQCSVLFLCTGNSARSQMAEALLLRHGGGRYEVFSAGTHPQGIHPLTQVVMGEIGLDIGSQRSKGLDEFLGKVPIHTVITVCDRAEKSCPTVWPGVVRRLAWSFADPAACSGTDVERLVRFRAVRDEIDARIRKWLEEEASGEERQPTTPV